MNIDQAGNLSTRQTKIAVVGDPSVGKTSLVTQFAQDDFAESHFKTIGVNVYKKSISNGAHTYRLIIWDLAGNSDLYDLPLAYLKGTDGTLIVGDMTRQGTLNSMERYARELTYLNPKMTLIFVGNKVDLAEKENLLQNKFVIALRDLASAFESRAILTSAKDDLNVNAAFVALAFGTPTA